MEAIYLGTAKRLDNIDLPIVGRLIGVGEDEVHAILDVESAGTGFDSQNRVRMLYEPHIFYRLLGPGKKRDAAVKQGLAYAKWKKGKYPKDSYPRLLAAMKIDREIALRSCSWGLGQVMGFNYERAGYKSAEEMVRHFAQDEENQLRAMITFIKKSGLDDELRRHDWRKFEDGYNGGGFNGAYAKKLKESFERWLKIKDTPIPEPETPIPEPAKNDAGVPSEPKPVSSPSPTVVAVPVGIIAAGAVGQWLGQNWVFLAVGLGIAAAAGAFIIYRRSKK